ncbi:thyroid hormone receptor-associated protein 3 [Astyanax mexicanus]|uniref:thyroid hormone receptor-associated protein 3 n=1 Tax=Astyanax mexicanus TaxID=7994 RepID=UPI0020CB300C|nr:thyroid hormone receptor-associated protein 3 [Astyanax mexicanus]
MSKPQNSPSRDSRSRSRSRSRSYSRSRSSSRSRSRSRKHRYSSRSRSRSHSRERNYPSRDFQGNRGYTRGYRGYRRPFYYNRGRGRGYFPRGYNRGGGGGGGGGGNYGYRSNNWHGGHRDQQQPYEHHSHSPKRGRSRSRTPRKRSGSRSRSHYSERSSSRSRHSSSSSRSSSPRRRSSGKRRSKDSKSKGSPGDGKALVKEEEPAKTAPAVPEEPPSKWESMSDYDTSPKQSGLAQPPAGGQPEVKVSISGSSANSASLWRSIESKSPPKPASSTSTGFGFFSKEDMKTGDKSAQISTAFKKFLAEKKKPSSDWDDNPEEDASAADAEKEKNSRKQRGLFDTDPVYSETKSDKGLPFLDEEEEAYLKGLKERKTEEESKYKGKATLSARELFEERFGKWDDDSYGSNKDAPPQPEDDAEDEEQVLEELYRSRKQAARKEEKASKKKEKKKNRASPSSPSPSRGSERGRPLFPAAQEVSPPAKSSKKRDPEFNFSLKTFNEEAESSGGALSKERRLSQDLVHPAKKDQEEFRSIFQHIQAAQLRRSPSELFAQHIVTIVHHIKAQHFRSSGMTLNERFGMYQRKAAQMEMMRQRKSPEIHRRIDVSPSAFKKHSRLFEDMEESEYKDYSKKYEGESMDLRLDIERRKKYPKREGGKGSAGSRTPSRELSPDKPSKHKKSKKSKKKRERSPSSSSSSSPSPQPYRSRDYHGEEEHAEKGGFDKSRLGPREYPGPMDRGPRDYEGGHMERGYERGRGGYDRGGYDRGGYDRGGYDRGRGGHERGFPRMRGGRGWNRGNYPGNNNNGNPANVGGPIRPQDEEWDPEYTPKSRKYFQHDDRDREAEMKWPDGRGRGRGQYPRTRGSFTVRRGSGSGGGGVGGGSGSSPKWTHDMFQGAAEEGELADDGPEHGHKDEDKTGESESSKP